MHKAKNINFLLIKKNEMALGRVPSPTLRAHVVAHSKGNLSSLLVLFSSSPSPTLISALRLWVHTLWGFSKGDREGLPSADVIGPWLTAFPFSWLGSNISYFEFNFSKNRDVKTVFFYDSCI